MKVCILVPVDRSQQHSFDSVDQKYFGVLKVSGRVESDVCSVDIKNVQFSYESILRGISEIVGQDTDSYTPVERIEERGPWFSSIMLLGVQPSGKKHLSPPLEQFKFQDTRCGTYMSNECFASSMTRMVSSIVVSGENASFTSQSAEQGRDGIRSSV